MKRQLLTLSILLVVVAGTVAGVAYLRNSQEATRQNQQEKQKTSQTTTSDSAPKDDIPGSYVAYSRSALDEAEGRRVLFFHASWCPQCRMIEADIKKSTVPNGVTIFKVDYDSNQELRQKYDVTLQTTFVEIDDEGEPLTKYVAYNEPTFDSVKENVLKK